MKPGAFSISLSVKDIHASRQFHENLGFTVSRLGRECSKAQHLQRYPGYTKTFENNRDRLCV